jgi:hypothetical protein
LAAGPAICLLQFSLQPERQQPMQLKKSQPSQEVHSQLPLAVHPPAHAQEVRNRE